MCDESEWMAHRFGRTVIISYDLISRFICCPRKNTTVHNQVIIKNDHDSILNNNLDQNSVIEKLSRKVAKV